MSTNKVTRNRKEPKTLLEGKPYTPACSTNVLKTFLKYGWVPPSEVRK